MLRRQALCHARKPIDAWLTCLVAGILSLPLAPRWRHTGVILSSCWLHAGVTLASRWLPVGVKHESNTNWTLTVTLSVILHFPQIAMVREARVEEAVREKAALEAPLPFDMFDPALKAIRQGSGLC